FRFAAKLASRLRGQVKSLVEYAGTEEKHEDLVVGDASSFVHGVDAVEEADDLLLIEERDGCESRTAECVFDEHAELALAIERGRRAKEWMLLAAVDGVGDDVAHGFAKDELLGHAVNLLADGERADGFDDAVVEERDTAFDGVRHLHAVAEHAENVTGERGL